MSFDNKQIWLKLLNISSDMYNNSNISYTATVFFSLFFFFFFFTKENPSYSTAVEHYSSNLLHSKTENPVICQKIWNKNDC